MVTNKRLLLALQCCMIVPAVLASTEQGLRKVSTSGQELLPQATLVEHVSPDTKLDFIVWLQYRNVKQLKQLADDVHNPQSPRYRQFLTVEQLNETYAPTQEAAEKVLDYFQAQGMKGQIINHSVRITAPVKQIEAVLHLKINRYRYQNKLVYANASAPSLPAELAKSISEITGLSNIDPPRPMFQRAIGSKTPNSKIPVQALNLQWDQNVPLALPTSTSLNGFTGPELQITYNIANIPPISGTTIDGTGQTIVIVDACGTNSEATIYANAGSYTSSTNIPTLDASNLAFDYPLTACTTGQDSWNGEIALDIQSAHTLAPGAKIVLAQAKGGDVATALIDLITLTLPNNNYTLQGFSNAYVISNSWGYLGSETTHTAFETALASAAAINKLSINFSTGDCGDRTYTSSACTAQTVNPSVSYPASSTYVTALGGSSLFVDANWNYAFEAGWGTAVNSSFYFGGGGGVSSVYGPPSWQAGISNFTAGGYASITKRALPDISMLGDPHTGLNIYYTDSGGGCSSTPCTTGGTSLSCPLFSATLALLNQATALLANNTQKPIGLAAPYLYNYSSTNYNTLLINAEALNVIVPPHVIFDNASLPPNGAPTSAFTLLIGSNPPTPVTFSWDSALTIVENQYWNDVVGVGSPNIPNFVYTLANLLK